MDGWMDCRTNEVIDDGSKHESKFNVEQGILITRVNCLIATNKHTKRSKKYNRTKVPRKQLIRRAHQAGPSRPRDKLLCPGHHQRDAAVRAGVIPENHLHLMPRYNAFRHPST
eukprot:scaffold307958_cov34-Prasinocladus_malaysianus.AAC.2